MVNLASGLQQAETAVQGDLGDSGEWVEWGNLGVWVEFGGWGECGE